MSLSLLEKHIPSAKLHLQDHLQDRRIAIPVERASEAWEEVPSDETEFLCVYGLSAPFYAKARRWLDENPVRRLIFVEDQGGVLAPFLKEEDALLLLSDRRVKIYFLETLLQIGPIAKKVAWQAVFRKLSAILLRETETGNALRQEVEAAHLAAHLLLSEAADWGCAALRNGRANRAPFRSGIDLKGRFSGVPAVIAGAGPSLEKNGRLLRQLENRALLFAGGAALRSIDGEPHFAAFVDPEAAVIHKPSRTPWLYKARMDRELFSQIQGERLLWPDGSGSALDWLYEMEVPFDGGWTVGNFGTAAALWMGCDPIVFVGMDFCYRKGKKYAGLDAPLAEGCVETADRFGNAAATQRDWLMAVRWMEELAARFPERTFIDATEGGLGFKPPILAETLAEAMEKRLPLRPSLREKVDAEIAALPLRFPSNRWEKWDASLRRSETICSDLANYDATQLEEEIVFQKLLLPLWLVWKPVFERELELDLDSLALEEKLKLHQALFFQQVLQEHKGEPA